MEKTPWVYEGQAIDSSPAGALGFVYLITRLDTGRMYVGQKLFWGKRKGKDGKRRKVESDWKKYWGSSEELKSEVASLGEENFSRTILKLCESKGEMNYEELREQVMRDVLRRPVEYYNAFVGGKIHRKHVWKG